MSAHNMISNAERINFLMACGRTGRPLDAIRFLALPLRASLWRARRSVQRALVVTVAPAPAPRELPSLSPIVNPVFNWPCPSSNPLLAPETLLTDVEGQSNGIYRLGGGRYHRLVSGALDRLDDIEDRHAFHRLYWAARYAQAAALGHGKAFEALTRELPAWLDAKCVGDSVAMAPYTVSERIGSLAECLFWLEYGRKDQATALIAPVKRRIWRDACHLSRNVEVGLGTHNHVLNNARALCLAAAALQECDEAAEWRRRGFEIWDEAFPKLVLEDGTFAEQSSHYHLLLCRTGLEYWLAAKSAKHVMPQGFEPRLRLMFQLANDLLRSDGTLPRFGDSSPDHIVSDLWGLMAAARHHGLLKESPRHPVITPLTVYYGGIPAQAHASASIQTVRVYPHGGLAFLRSPVSGAELAVHGDPRAGTSVHGDTGRGTFELWWRNQVLIQEPGSYLSASDPRCRYYRSASAQNVTCLSRLAPGLTAEEGRDLPGWYWSNGGAWKALPPHGIQFNWQGFRRLDAGIELRRTWQFDSAGNLSMLEHITGSSAGGARSQTDRRLRFESRLCLGDGCWRELQRAGASGNANIRWQDAGGAAAAMSIEPPAGTQITIRPCTFLIEYGVEKPGRVLYLSGRVKLPTSWRVRWNFLTKACH